MALSNPTYKFNSPLLITSSARFLDEETGDVEIQRSQRFQELEEAEVEDSVSWAKENLHTLKG